MLEMSLTGHLFKPSITKFSKAFHIRLVGLWKGAIGAFIEEIVFRDVIKVDTGMSMASLIPLAERIRQGKLVRAHIQSKRGPRLGYTDISGAYHPKQLKSKAHGERLGERAYTVEFGNPMNPKLVFSFSIVVYQYALQERGIHGNAWLSLQKGGAAFEQYIRDNMKNVIPDTREWIDLEPIR